MRLKKVLSLVTAISTMLVTSSYQIAFAESDFTSESKISEELVVNADVSATSVVLVYQAMSRADYLEMYNDCYDTAKTEASENTDGSSAAFEEIFEKMLADRIETYALQALADLNLERENCTFDSVYPVVQCSLTEEQLQAAESMASVAKVLPLDVWTTPEDAGVQPFDYVAQSDPSSVISDKLMAQINAGKQAIEVTMLYKDIDLSDIIEEVRQKGEAYEGSLDPDVYTPDGINEMTGSYKEKLNAELVAAATAARQKEICDSLGIAVEDVTFVGITRMICTLTPEQIYKAAESDWLYKGITLREEFVSSDDLGLVTTAPADEITTTETSAVTTASSTEKPTVTTTETCPAEELVTTTETTVTITTTTTAETSATEIITTTTETAVPSGNIEFQVVSGHGWDTDYRNESPAVYRDAENLPQSFISDEDYTKYDTAFFEDHALIYLKLAEPSGSITETVKSVTVDKSGTWHITVESRIPDNQTADMMAWAHYIAVPSTLPDDVKIVVDRVKTDADGNQLPQTGYSNFYKTIVELAALMVAGGVTLVVKSKKESK